MSAPRMDCAGDLVSPAMLTINRLRAPGQRGLGGRTTRLPLAALRDLLGYEEKGQMINDTRMLPVLDQIPAAQDELAGDLKEASYGCYWSGVDVMLYYSDEHLCGMRQGRRTIRCMRLRLFARDH